MLYLAWNTTLRTGRQSRSPVDDRMRDCGQWPIPGEAARRRDVPINRRSDTARFAGAAVHDW